MKDLPQKRILIIEDDEHIAAGAEIESLPSGL